MSTIALIVLVPLVILAGVWLWNKRAASNLYQAGRAQVGKAGRAAIAADPEAVARQALEDEAQKVNSGLEGLGLLAGFLRQLTDQVKDEEAERTRLETRIAAVDEAGDPENTLTGYAQSLVLVEEQLARNRAQLVNLTAEYKAKSAQVQQARQRIKDGQRRLEQRGAELKISEAVRAATASTSALPTGSSQDFDEAMRVLDQRIYANQGASDASSVDNEQAAAEARDKEREQKAAAQSVIARIRAKKSTSQPSDGVSVN